MNRAQVLSFMAALVAAIRGPSAAELYLVPLYSCAAIGVERGAN